MTARIVVETQGRRVGTKFRPHSPRSCHPSRGRILDNGDVSGSVVKCRIHWSRSSSRSSQNEGRPPSYGFRYPLTCVRPWVIVQWIGGVCRQDQTRRTVLGHGHCISLHHVPMVPLPMGGTPPEANEGILTRLRRWRQGREAIFNSRLGRQYLIPDGLLPNR